MSTKIFSKRNIEDMLITAITGDDLITWDSGLSAFVPTSEPKVGAVLFDILASGQEYIGGQIHWNAPEYTLNIDTGLGGTELQIGQEIYIIFFNNSPTPISDLMVVRPVAGAVISGHVYPVFEPALANIFDTAEGTLAVTTMDVPASGLGIATRFGRVRGVDTSIYTQGAGLFLSATASGELVETQPEFPNYAISMGGVAFSDSEDGEFFVSVTRDVFDTTLNFWNGVFRETINFTVSSDGAVITGSLEPANGHEDMTMMFSDGLSMLDTNPPATIVLTAGTDDVPQMNFVYVLESTKVLTVATGDWPVTEHIKVADVLLRSASTTETDGAYGNRNWNDHIQSTLNDQGHLSHITEKLRQFEAQWHSGVEGSVDIIGASSPDDVYFRNTAGKAYQLHKQDFPLLDMNQYSIDAVSIGSKTFTISDDGDLSSTFPDARMIQVNNSTGNDKMYNVASTSYSDPDFVITVEEVIPDATADGTIGDDIHIINNFAAPNVTVLNLNTQTLDSTGSSLTNRSFSFVIWGVQNKTGQASHLICNLPSGSYNSSANAISDALSYSNYSIPSDFQGIGFLIARATFSLSAAGGGSWTLENLEDLRGKVPNSTAGGGSGGGSGVTTFLALTDVPSSYAGEAGKLAVINAGETALEFGTTITNGFIVDGSTDEVQTIIQAHSTQTSNILEIQDSSSNILSGADERGILFSDGGSVNTNAFFGAGAGNILASGGGNVGLGFASLMAVTTGASNMGIGTNALRDNLGGDNNIAIGTNSLLLNTGGDDNISLGTSSLDANLTGIRNIAIGSFALSTSTGNLNTSIGYASGILSTGSNNIFLGALSGSKQTALSNLFIADNQSRADIATELTNSILYGVMAATPANQTLRINAYLGINVTPTSAGIELADANDLIFGTATGTKIGTATNQKLGFFNATPIVQPTEITDELSTITHTAPGTPDYAVQDLVDSGVGSAFGFATKDEGNTVLSVVENLQTRVNELEAVLSSLGLLADAD